MNKYEQLIESILNEDEATAKALFHDIVVAKSREIYESLMDEELGGNQSQQFVQDLTQQDEQAQDMGLGEDDLEGGEIELDGGDDFGGDDEGFGDEETFGGDEATGDDSDAIAKIDDLEAQLADLKAMLGGEEGEELGGEEPAGDDFGGEEGESDFDMDGGEEATSGEEADDELEEAFNFEKSGSGKSGSGKSGSGVSGSGKSGSGKMEGYARKTEAEIMKEYVDKIGEIYKQEPAAGEGKEVGNGGSTTVGTKSIDGPGADFGGESKNIATGGAEQNPDGKQFSKPKNVYSKGETTFSNEKFQNAPGANAGKSSFKTKETAKKPEGSTTDGSVPVAKKSVQVQNTGKK